MKGKNNYIPTIGERVLISGPNCDNENGYVFSEFSVLWINDKFILYGNDNMWPNLQKLEHVKIKQLMSLSDAIFVLQNEQVWYYQTNGKAIMPNNESLHKAIGIVLTELGANITKAK